MLNIETKELKINDKLKRKIELIGRFTNTTPIINNGSIKNITSTNVAYNGFRTRIEIENYVNKLKEMYDVNYYEVIPNKDFTNLSFTPKNDIEKIIRIIPIKDNDKFKSIKLKLGIITINLSNIKGINGTPLYKNIFKTMP